MPVKDWRYKDKKDMRACRCTFPVLVVFMAVSVAAASCNPYKVLPEARCRLDYDCVRPPGRCIEGLCKLTAQMDMTVTYTRIFRKDPGKRPLVVEMTLVPEGKRKYGCEPPWSYRQVFQNLSWPLERTLKGFPDGKYAAIAFLDSNRNGALDRGEIFASDICFAQTLKQGTVEAECALELLYPF
jgi:hypothetical protein